MPLNSSGSCGLNLGTAYPQLLLRVAKTTP